MMNMMLTFDSFCTPVQAFENKQQAPKCVCKETIKALHALCPYLIPVKFHFQLKLALLASLSQ